MLQQNDLRSCLDALHELRSALDRLGSATECTPSPPASLTCREREVLQWLSGGKTDRDIGHILGISPRTVHKHLQRIYEKLGVETRTAAVVRMLSWGA